MLSAGDDRIIDSFNIAHTIAVEKLSSISFIPKSFNPMADDNKTYNKKRRSVAKSSRRSEDSKPPAYTAPSMSVVSHVCIFSKLSTFNP